MVDEQVVLSGGSAGVRGAPLCGAVGEAFTLTMTDSFGDGTFFFGLCVPCFTVLMRSSQMCVCVYLRDLASVQVFAVVVMVMGRT